MTFEEREVPYYYRTGLAALDLGETMPMWRVQKEGYKDANGMPAGVVCPPRLDDSPDGEFISSGDNTKGYRSVAIGRQGNFMHWGFTASPEYMTEQASLVFVNAIHYISRFAGKPAYVGNICSKSRDQIRSLMYSISDEGWSRQLIYFEKNLAELRRLQDEYKAQQANGVGLSGMGMSILLMQAIPVPSRRDILDYLVPDDIQKRFGEDWGGFVRYYEKHLPYLYPGEGSTESAPLVVDKDARKLGIANNNIKLLEHCVESLEQNPRDEVALRLLYRYTNKRFSSTEEWSSWLVSNRDSMFFTEMGGFKFMAGPDDSVGLGAENNITVPVGIPTEDEPVKSAATISLSCPGFAKLVLKLSILPGWYIYADVPEGQPFQKLSFEVNSEQLVASEIMLKTPPNKFILDEPVILGYEGKVTFTQDFIVTGEVEDSGVTLTIKFQACNIESCQQPETREVGLPFTQ